MSKEYWEAYNPLQYYKHEILKNYLQAWYPILSSFSGRVIYFDCFAGKGKHETGEEGSPLLAIKSLLNHNYKEKILNSTKLHFIFIEYDENNSKLLEKEIRSLEPLPDNINYKIITDDYENTINNYFDDLDNKGKKFAPSFFFVDPFGFSLSINTLNRMLKYPKTELLINFMYRYISMAINNDANEDNMNKLFGTSKWKDFKYESSSKDESIRREKGILKLFTSQLNAKHNVEIPFKGKNTVTKYYLIHSSNHEKAAYKMKNSIWRSISRGSFSVSAKENPKQKVLIEPDVDLTDLEDWLWENYSGKNIYVNQIYNNLISTIYLKKHLHNIIRKYRNNDIIKCTEYGNRFAFKRNPKIHFPNKRP